jgi:hypothetical protein
MSCPGSRSELEAYIPKPEIMSRLSIFMIRLVVHESGDHAYSLVVLSQTAATQAIDVAGPT